MVFSVCVVLLVTVWQASAQAPGDEDRRCLNERAQANDVYPPFTRMLMDSRNYEELISGSRPHWQQLDVDGTGSGWTSTLGGLCAYEARVCDFRESTSQENWVFTQYISYLQARQVFVNISAGLTECRLAQNPPCNRLYFDVYRYERNGRNDAAARTTSNYQLIQRVQQPNGFAQRTYRTSFPFNNSNNFNGFYIGVKDTGSCVNIQRIQVYYSRSFQPTAPVDPDPAVICPRTGLPPAGSTASVTCSCPGNSVATSSLQLTCHPDGTCTGNPRCRCHDGYQKLPQECRDARPRIVTPPQRVVTAVADGVQCNITFNCTAFGDPTPHISWMHNMQNVSQNGRFQVMATEDGRNHNNSTLAMNSLTATDSGIVRCVADNGFGHVSADTNLSVLTSDFNLSITVAANVRFVVTLFEGYSIPQPVRLRIIFTSAEAARTGTRNMTSEFHFNESTMIHEVPNSEVPYIQFKAQVALTVESKAGPLVPILDSAPVYQIPRIETPPEPGVVAVADGETQSTTFTCTAAAVNVTVLQISWIHKEQIFIQSQGRVEITEDREALSLATSRLTLHNLTAEDNGIIQCVADDPTDMTSTSANTTLSVLTDDFQLEVVVTEEGLMLTVTLQTAIPGPVRLRIKYTWIVQPDTVERNTSTTFENMRVTVQAVSRSTIPFQKFRLQVALVVGRVVGPFVPDLENATVITLRTAQSSGLIISLSVLVPFSVLLVLIISLTVPTVILKMRKKKVETIQDYASTAIELLSKGNPLQLPPQPPPYPPPHLPRQYPRQCPPRLPSHDNTIIINEGSSINDGHSQTHPEDLEHHRGSQSVSINTGKQKNKSETLPISAQPSHPITRPDIPSQPSQPTTRTDPPTQPSRNDNDDHPTTDWIPTETSRKETSSEDNVCKISKGVSSNGEQNIVGTGYGRIATYETVGNVYDKIGTYESITPTSSSACPTPRTDAPTQEETASKHKISKRASFVNKEGQNVATAATVSNSQESSKSSPPVCTSQSVGSSEGAKVTDSLHKKTPQLHADGHYEVLGTVYERIATYETVGNVYERIGTYETIGNVCDKIGTYETITATSSIAHSTPRTDTPTQEESASNDNTSEGASANEGGLNMATTAGVSHFQESSKGSPPVCVSGKVGSSEGAKVTDLATYETVGNVYDRICTYETIGNVYDNSLVPKLGFHETGATVYDQH